MKVDCRNLDFSTGLSEERIARAEELFGAKILQRVLCLGLYLLGVNRTQVSEALGIAPGSVRSILRALHQQGLPAFEDRRRRRSSFLPPESKALPLRVEATEEWVVVQCGLPENALRIQRQHGGQVRAVLLSLLNSGLLSTQEVARVLELTPAHTRQLAQKLEREGLPAVIDQRRGQQQDYRFTPEVKAEVIQQFVLDVLVEGKATGAQLCQHLRERCQLSVPERSVRHHVRTLGLKSLADSLPALLAAAKKNSPT